MERLLPAFGLLAACASPGPCPCPEQAPADATGPADATEAVDAGCEPEFIDLSGEWTADALEDLRTAYEEWSSLAGACRVNIDRFEVDRVPQGLALEHADGTVGRIDLNISDRDTAMYQLLCRELDLVEDLSSRLDGLQDADGIDAYAEYCEDGPRDYGWVEQVEAACGSTGLSAADELMREVVYPLAPRARVDGDVEAVAEEPLRISGLLAGGWSVKALVADGEALVLGLYGGLTSRIVRVDPDTGATTELLEIVLPDLDDSLSGGPGGAVLSIPVTEISSRMLVVLDENELLTVPSSVPQQGVVADGWYYAVSYDYEDVISAVELATGWSTTLPVPTPEGWDVVDVVNYYALTSGFAVRLVSGGTYPDALYQYDPVAANYRPLLSDADALGPFYEIGTDRLATFAVGEAGTALAVVDAATDRLLVTDDVCVEAAAHASTPGRLWWVAEDGDDVVLTAVRIE